MSSPLPAYLSTLVVQLPLLLAYVAALVFCATRWNRYPRPAQLAFLGTTFLLLASIAHPLINMAITTNFRGNSALQMSQMLTITGLISSIVRATGFLFILGAVFIHRTRTDPHAAFPFATPAQQQPGH